MSSRDVFIRLLLYSTTMILIFIIPLVFALLGHYYRDYYFPLLVSGFISILIGAMIALKKLN